MPPQDRDPANGARSTRHPPIRIQAFLANLPLFSDASGEELDRIALGTLPVHARKGEAICQRGDPCTGLHVVVFGQVKLGFTSPQGVEKVVEIVTQGQSFGEALMFLDKPYIVFAQALADSMMLHVSKQVIQEELRREPDFAMRMLSGLSRRLHGLVRDVEAYTLRSGAERVIGYLLRDAPDAQDTPDAPVDITLTPGKSVIASRLNMTPEHFSRILHELSQHGLIEVNGRVIRIPDLARLQGSESRNA